MENKKHVLLKIFVSTLYLSAFTFGGGYVIVTLMKKKFVDEYHWIEDGEMLDLVAIAQSAPGAIAVNGAIVVGYKLAGIIGAAVAILATILPPFVIISLISVFYNAFRTNFLVSQMLEGMQAGVAAVICDVVIRMGSGVFKEKNALFVIIMAAAFILTFFLDVNVIFIILGCILLSVCIFLFKAAAKSKKRRKSLSKNVNPTSLAPSDGEQDAAQKEEQALKSSAREAESAQGQQTSEDKPLSVGKQTATSEHTENTEHTATPEQSTVTEQTLTLDKTGNTEQTLAPEHTENPEQKATPEKKELDSPKGKAAPKKTVGKSGKSVSPSEREKEREK